MTEKQTAPYGSWKSPITSDLIVSDSIGIGQMVLDGSDMYWLEFRPSEGGRAVIVRRTPDGKQTDMNPPPFNARTRVHEYGGGSYTVSHGVIYFSNFTDQRIYRQTVDSGSEPQPITPEAALRYADFVVDPTRNALICVREDHMVEGREAVNTLVRIPLDGNEQQILVSGNDFYSSPRLSPDGKHLAWLTWNHPNMPWNGTELWVGELNEDGTNGIIGQKQRVAGSKNLSIFQPQWSPDGTLYFISEQTGWWNLYKWQDEKIVPLHEMDAEFGRPQWVFGMSMYAFASSERIICTYIQKGICYLASLDTKDGTFTPLETPYTEIGGVCATSEYTAFVAGSPTEIDAIVRLDLATSRIEVLRRTGELTFDQGYLSIPRTIEFPTEHGQTAYAFFYSPRNKDYQAPQGELPPLLVMIHGGPTGATSDTLNLETQYWTSRGIAVLDVNYGGSTGYGKEYRDRLNGQWGIVDVDDCINGANYLVKEGLVDGNRLMITGGSAGGYTTLAALTFRDTFKAGASHFGVSDIEALGRDSHKFESRYETQVIGPYPESRQLYYDRSPIHFTDRLSCPVIFFQGLDDKVVPPNQAEMMVDALRQKGLPVAYIPFEGEGHGFRRAENIKRALEGELYFYSRVFGFPLTDKVEPVEIENL